MYDQHYRKVSLKSSQYFLLQRDIHASKQTYAFIIFVGFHPLKSIF